MNPRSKLGKAQCGTALIEISIVLPLLFMLVAGAFELSRGIAVRASGETFAQELARAVFHDCKDPDISDAIAYTAEEAQACLRSQVQTLHGYFTQTYPRSVAIASIFRLGAGGVEQFAGPEISCPAAVEASGEYHCADYITRFSSSRAEAELRNLTSTTDWVVVAETYVASNSVLTGALVPVHLERRMFYAVAIL